MKKFILHLLIVLLCFSVSAWGESTKDAFIGIKEKALKKDYNYLAIAPIDAPEALKLPDSVKATIEAEVEARLKKEGFKLLPPSAMAEIRQQMNQLMAMDNSTHEEKQEKMAAVLDHSYRELLYRHDIDGIVALRIQVVAAPFANDKAEWDGTSQKIKHSGDGVMKFISGQKYGGSIAASSLKISIWDRKETLLYSWAGGIEVLMQREGKALNYLPAENFWQDAKRITKSVRLALKPF